jgi:hypothetical protein
VSAQNLPKPPRSLSALTAAADAAANDATKRSTDDIIKGVVSAYPAFFSGFSTDLDKDQFKNKYDTLAKRLKKLNTWISEFKASPHSANALSTSAPTAAAAEGSEPISAAPASDASASAASASGAGSRRVWSSFDFVRAVRRVFERTPTIKHLCSIIIPPLMAMLSPLVFDYGRFYDGNIISNTKNQYKPVIFKYIHRIAAHGNLAKKDLNQRIQDITDAIYYGNNAAIDRYITRQILPSNFYDAHLPTIIPAHLIGSQPDASTHANTSNNNNNSNNNNAASNNNSNNTNNNNNNNNNKAKRPKLPPDLHERVVGLSSGEEIMLFIECLFKMQDHISESSNVSSILPQFSSFIPSHVSFSTTTIKRMFFIGRGVDKPRFAADGSEVSEDVSVRVADIGLPDDAREDEDEEEDKDKEEDKEKNEEKADIDVNKKLRIWSEVFNFKQLKKEKIRLLH